MRQVWFSKVGLYMRTVEQYGRFGTFPVSADKGSETDETGPHATAKKWAGEGYRYVEVGNKGFSDVVLTDLDFRGNGGRAYKVVVTIDGLKHEVDLREDVMMDVLMTRGVEVGGRLNGTYCFVRRGSEIRLELEGSEGHAEALEEYRRVINGRKLKKSEMVAGHVYQGNLRNKYLYFGEVYVGSKVTDAGNPKKTMMFTSYFDSRADRYGDASIMATNLYEFKNSTSFTEDLTDMGEVGRIDVADVLDDMISAWDSLMYAGIQYYEHHMRVFADKIDRLERGVASIEDVDQEEVSMVFSGESYVANLEKSWPQRTITIEVDTGTVSRDLEEYARRSALYGAYELAQSNFVYKKKAMYEVRERMRYRGRWV